jgi:curved DNA-binding protein CbpA
MGERDYYEVLGLHPSADHQMVVQAYWHLAHKYKAAMDRDGAVGEAIEELNRSFEVLVCADRREAYDRARREGQADSDAAGQGCAMHRVSIEVVYWYLPGWRAILAATAALALAATALLAGAQPLVVLALALLTVGAALFVLPTERTLCAARARWLPHGRPKASTLELERSTALAIERWRQGDERQGATPSLAHLLRGADDAPYRPPFGRRAADRQERP